MARLALMMALVVLLTSCHRYVPVRIGTVPPGVEVRLRLSNEGAERVQEITGARRAEISGELLQWAEEVMISVPLRGSDGMLDRGIHQRLSVQANEVLGVDVRELDRTRTALLAGSVVAVAGAAIVWTALKVLGGTSASTPRENGGPPTPTVLGELIPDWLRVFR